jgi:hypothetical protein
MKCENGNVKIKSVNRQPPTVYRLRPTANCQLTTANRQRFPSHSGKNSHQIGKEIGLYNSNFIHPKVVN